MCSPAATFDLLLPSGTYVQSFGSIAPAVTKRALLTDAT
jgi:hypothetical protein